VLPGLAVVEVRKGGLADQGAVLALDRMIYVSVRMLLAWQYLGDIVQDRSPGDVYSHNADL
jgi:hypothetical protein